MQQAISFLGLVVLIGIAYLLSTNRKRIVWRPVIVGIALQFALAGFILGTTSGNWVFDKAKGAFTRLLDFSKEGSLFVFRNLADPEVMGEVLGPESGFIFAIHVAATIIFVSSVMAILYHLGVMQRIVYVMALVMQKLMKVSGAESLAAAANVFVGQTEAPLVVRPYLTKMTSSELTSLMCGGMATVAGGVLAAYVFMGVDAGHLLAASVMSAPAALAVAKLLVPETEHSETKGDVPLVVNKIDSNVLDAACRGAGEGLKLCLNVFAMLIAFIALMAMLNYFISSVHGWFLPPEVVEDPVRFAEEAWTIERILGVLLAPLAWLLGVEWKDAPKVAELIGVKTVLNEFIAYQKLGGMELSERSRVIATYALCGFANFSSIAIQIGGIGALEGSIRSKLARLGFLAMVGGTLAAMMTAAIAGILYRP